MFVPCLDVRCNRFPSAIDFDIKMSIDKWIGNQSFDFDSSQSFRFRHLIRHTISLPERSEASRVALPAVPTDRRLHGWLAACSAWPMQRLVNNAMYSTNHELLAGVEILLLLLDSPNRHNLVECVDQLSQWFESTSSLARVFHTIQSKLMDSCRHQTQQTL